MQKILLSFIVLFIFLLTPFLSFGETNASYSKMNHFGIGIKADANFSQLPNDFKFGICVNSPYLLDNWAALRLELDYGLIRGVPTNTIYSNETGANYTLFKAGIVLVASQKANILRPYIETGLIGVIPSSAFTDEKFAWGSYGLFGMDLMLSPGDLFAFFFEFGAAGLIFGGDTSKFVGKPVYANGIIITLGLRYYL
jgi:hypothetical protein